MEQIDFNPPCRQHYRSWSGLRKNLLETLAPSVQGRIDYYHTKFRQAHNAWGLAQILVDGEAWANFSWLEGNTAEWMAGASWREQASQREPSDDFWKGYFAHFHSLQDEKALYWDDDFLAAASCFLNMPLRQALTSDNSLLKILAVLDHRVGKRTLQSLLDDHALDLWPDWAKPFALLRMEAEGIIHAPKQAETL